MIVTSDEHFYKKLRRLRFYGMENTYYSEDAIIQGLMNFMPLFFTQVVSPDKYIAQERIADEYNKSLAMTSLSCL
jgi:hypothetical protein